MESLARVSARCVNEKCLETEKEKCIRQDSVGNLLVPISAPQLMWVVAGGDKCGCPGRRQRGYPGTAALVNKGGGYQFSSVKTEESSVK